MKPVIAIALCSILTLQGFALYRKDNATPENLLQYGLALDVEAEPGGTVQFILSADYSREDFSDVLIAVLEVKGTDDKVISSSTWSYLVDPRNPATFGRTPTGFSFSVREDLVCTSTLVVQYVESGELTFDLGVFWQGCNEYLEPNQSPEGTLENAPQL